MEIKARLILAVAICMMLISAKADAGLKLKSLYYSLGVGAIHNTGWTVSVRQDDLRVRAWKDSKNNSVQWSISKEWRWGQKKYRNSMNVRGWNYYFGPGIQTSDPRVRCNTPAIQGVQYNNFVLSHHSCPGTDAGLNWIELETDSYLFFR